MQTARSKPLIELRPYQHKAMEAITPGFTDYQHQLAVKPTGSGKTVLFSALAAHYQPERTRSRPPGGTHRPGGGQDHAHHRAGS